MYDPEGPSAEDIERFSDETGYCPVCGAEVWDMAPYCPKCRAAMPGGAQRHTPVQSHFQRKLMLVIIAILIIAFVMLVM